MLADKDDARDAVQEALTQTMAKRRIDDPMNYCYQAVRHSAIDIMRHRNRFVSLDEKELQNMSDETLSDYQAVMLERAMQVRDRLPENQRRLVVMHDEEGLSHAEIAKQTGMSKMTVRRLLTKAHATMRKELTKKKEDKI